MIIIMFHHSCKLYCILTSRLLFSPYLCRIWKLGNILEFQTVCKIFQTDINWTAISWYFSVANRSKGNLRNKFFDHFLVRLSVPVILWNGFQKDSHNFQENTRETTFFSKTVDLQRPASLGRDFMLKICWRQRFLQPE